MDVILVVLMTKHTNRQLTRPTLSLTCEGHKSSYNYEYKLDITRQKNLLKETTNLREGFRESYCWYKNNKDKVNRKAYLDFINKNFE